MKLSCIQGEIHQRYLFAEDNKTTTCAHVLTAAASYARKHELFKLHHSF